MIQTSQFKCEVRYQKYDPNDDVSPSFWAVTFLLCSGAETICVKLAVKSVKFSVGSPGHSPFLELMQALVLTHTKGKACVKRV